LFCGGTETGKPRDKALKARQVQPKKSKTLDLSTELKGKLASVKKTN